MGKSGVLYKIGGLSNNLPNNIPNDNFTNTPGDSYSGGKSLS